MAQNKKPELVLLAVTVEKDQTYPIFGLRQQEVDYRVEEYYGDDSFHAPPGEHTVTLSEKFTDDSPHKDASIANPPNSEKNTYQDTQGVKRGHDFSTERHWTIDGKPTRIFYEGTKDANGKILSGRFGSAQKLI